MLRKLLPNIFFLLFVAQILSPYVGGITIYLEILIAIADPYYIRWGSKVKNKLLFILLFTVIPILFAKIAISIKILSLMISVSYLFYAAESKVFYLKRYFIVSIIVAILQFSLFYINPNLSFALGPSNIAQTLWGEYATQTYTNFFEVYIGFIRVSGLSREAGFFASLLISVMLLCYMNYRLYNIKVSKLFLLLLCIAFVISFSKMSLMIVPVYLCVRYRKIINRIPNYLIVLSVFMVFIALWYHSDFLSTEENSTFTHRFGAYGILPDINDASNLLFGNSRLAPQDYYDLYARRYINIIGDYDSFAGMGGYIISNGLLLTAILLIILCNTGISSTGILLLFILTVNVSLDTNQNFVVLAYYIVFKYFYGSSKRTTLLAIHNSGISKGSYSKYPHE